MKATKAELIKSIERHGGIMSHIAREFGLTIRGVQKRVAKDPDLQDAVTQAREQLIDEAEAGLRLAVKERRPWALKLVLTTLGRHRGYTQRVEVETNGDRSNNVTIVLPDNGRAQLQQAEPKAFVEA
jgi:hypothetical protein